MLYQFMADLVVVVHFAFIVFAVFGGLLALRWRRLPWIHVPAVAWAAYVEISGSICPLTPLEHSLRVAGGERGYEGDFIDEYLVPIIYPPGLTPRIQLVLGFAFLVLNAAVYLMVWRRWKSHRVDRGRAQSPAGRKA